MIAVNLYAHLMTVFWSDVHEVAQEFGAVPAYWSPLTMISAQFVHGGWWHLLGNMLFLYLFGEGVEQVAGHAWTLVGYLASGIMGSLVRLALDSDSTIPSIGASGCICGLAGAYAVLFPKEKTRLHFIVFKRYVGALEVAAWIAVGAWLVEQVLVSWFARATGIGAGVDYGAHVTGMVTGGVLAAALLAAHGRLKLGGDAWIPAHGPACVRCETPTMEAVPGLFRCARCKKWSVVASPLKRPIQPKENVA